MHILRWIIALPIVIGAVLFALANPQIINLTWSPFHDPRQLPLYTIVLGFLALGFLLGMFMAWVGMHGTRKEKREYKKQTKRLEKELKETNEKLMEALSKRGSNTLDGTIPTLLERADYNDA